VKGKDAMISDLAVKGEGLTSLMRRMPGLKSLP
jgi:hypothetical protein